ncbi:hypothetical protein BDV3_005679 [Batrachochytrium dendrobatidis]|nr:phosphatidylcholine and lysophosphatidylcholine phospholipase [Batrachochytrium dendrobatidis]KAK5673491.1 phosphatidylcholine and lysophosphatidylcholine phospholipase [Batrachochytrium dendrobatidis]
MEMDGAMDVAVDAVVGTILTTVAAALATSTLESMVNEPLDSQSTTTVTAQPIISIGKPSDDHDTQTSALSDTATIVALILRLIFGHTPWLVYRFLSYTVTATITLDLWSVLGLLSLISLVVYLLIRYRLLNTYTHLKTPAPIAPRAPFDLQPDATLDDDTDLNKGYPDEFMNAFLSSIKVFGYLDKPVFHELARHLQTRKLKTGEILFDEDSEDRDFYVVVDGCVQIYLKGNSNALARHSLGSNSRDHLDEYGDFEDRSDSDDPEDEFSGHHLLNEVKAGETVSSLFTILSLFTEDFELSTLMQPHSAATNLNESHGTSFSSKHSGFPQAQSPAFSTQLDSDESAWLRFNHLQQDSSIDSTPTPETAHPDAKPRVFPSAEANPASDPAIHQHLEKKDTSAKKQPQDVLPRLTNLQPTQSPSGHALGYIPQNVFPSLRRRNSTSAFSDVESSHGVESVDGSVAAESGIAHGLDGSEDHKHFTHPTSGNHIPKRKHRSVHPGIITRASSPTTLAVIPAQAFRKLTEKFPNAAAHIVQVILTRFQRVTFLTLYRYLGLSKELLKIERQVNQFSGYGLPTDLFPPEILHDLRLRTIRKRRGINNTFVTNEVDSSNGNEVDRRMSEMPGSRGTYNVNDDTASLTISMGLTHSQQRNHRRAHRNVVEINEYNNTADSSENDTAGPAKPPRKPNAKSSYRPTRLNDEADGPIKEAVFKCIAQLIGMRPYVAPYGYQRQYSLHEQIPNRTGSMATSGFRQSGPPGHSNLAPMTDRLYYSRSRTSWKPTSSTVFSIGSARASHPKTPDETTSPSNSTGNFSIDSSDQVEIDIMYFEHGQTLVKEGERGAGLYFVLDGVLEASMSTSNSQLFPIRTGDASQNSNPSSRGKSRRNLFLIHPGGLAGYLAALTGQTSFVTIKAKTDAHVGFMSKQVLDKYVERFPDILLCLAKRLVNQLSPLVLHIDVALEWGQVNAGQVLCRQGEPSTSIYIVLTGRLRAIVERSRNGIESLDILGEYGQLESVGEMEVLMDAPRTATIHAIRDTEVAIMPKTLFNALAIGHPEITISIARIIAARSTQSFLGKMGPGQQPSFNMRGSPDSGNNNVNLKTVAILPVTSIVPVFEFADHIRDALQLIGASVAFLNTASVMRELGKHAFTRLGRLKLMSWLSEQEESHRLVLYVADGGVSSPWTQRCVRQADCILLVGLGDEDPGIGEFERLLIGMKTTARKELVLLHNQRACIPGSTAQWLKNRVWVHAHHHVQMNLNTPKLLNKTTQKQLTLINLKSHFQRVYTSMYPMNSTGKKSSAPNIYSGVRSDFARLARRLLSKSIGLVLGGGGARGFAHIGVIRAFEEAGIPVDMIGGTSMGSFVGGCYARENDHVSVYGRAKMLGGRLGSTWRSLIDLTYPITAIFTGHEFNRGIWKVFSDTQIEDCWISYFAVTTNLNWSRMEVHQTGYMWRYIRASMSLSGYLPPLCDHGSMLLDGGYINNLPADIMHSLGAHTIIAVDVSLADDTSPVSYGDSVSGWWMLLSKLNPFPQSYSFRPPEIADIQSRLTYISSVKQLEDAKRIDGCLYIHPPVAAYTAMDFKKFKEIVEVGYKFGQTVVQEWHNNGTLQRQLGVTLADSVERKLRGGRRASI